MVDRSYLSIGDVLALLRGEFPDITISKIRFLESRGLLDPERTPSGYRKFCPPDVERLRWILRQQRENFLPLKVIKGRLEDAGTGEPAADEPLGQGEDVAPLDAGDGDEPLVAVVHELVGAAASGPAERPPPATGATGSSRGSPSHAGDPGYLDVATEEGDRPAAGGTEPAAEGRHDEAPADAVRPVTAGDGSAGAEEEDPPAELEPEPEPAPAAMSAAHDAGVSGVSLTAGELAEAAGLSNEEIAALVDYGLIEGRPVAGVTCFDEESLIVSRLAAGFARYGLEPRHLRIFKHSAEREAGLFAQVVTGMFRQRNPEARRRAYEALDELTELERGIHASLLRAALRDLTGG